MEEIELPLSGLIVLAPDHSKVRFQGVWNTGLDSYAQSTQQPTTTIRGSNFHFSAPSGNISVPFLSSLSSLKLTGSFDSFQHALDEFLVKPESGNDCANISLTFEKTKVRGKGNCFLGDFNFSGICKRAATGVKVFGSISVIVPRSHPIVALVKGESADISQAEDIESPYYNAPKRTKVEPSDELPSLLFPLSTSTEGPEETILSLDKPGDECLNPFSDIYHSSLASPTGSFAISRMNSCNSLKYNPRGKRLECRDWQTSCPADPQITGWKYLGEERIRVNWSFPVALPGQILKMNLKIRRKSSKSSRRSQKNNKSKVSPIESKPGVDKAYKPDIIPSDIFGVEKRSRSRLKEFNTEREITFPLVAVKVADYGCTQNFSAVLPGFSTGDYSLEVEVKSATYDDITFSKSIPSQKSSKAVTQQLPNTISGFDANEISKNNGHYALKRKASQGGCFGDFAFLDSNLDGASNRRGVFTTTVRIDPLPPAPVDFSCLIGKSKFLNSMPAESDGIIYELFGLCSWSFPGKITPGALSQRNRGPEFELQVEVLRNGSDEWTSFGEPNKMAVPNLPRAAKINCTIVALPENREISPVSGTIGNRKPSSQQFSKFRVAVKSMSIFGCSAWTYSPPMDVPTVSVKSVPSSLLRAEKPSNAADVDFNCDEANCVICGEDITFEEAYENIGKMIHEGHISRRSLLMNSMSHSHVFNGNLYVEQKMNSCPVTPSCCSHLFHLKCLLDWSHSSRERLENEFDESNPFAKCPLCMQEFSYIYKQSLDPNKQESREIFSYKTMLQDEETTRPLPRTIYPHAIAGMFNSI